MQKSDVEILIRRSIRAIKVEKNVRELLVRLQQDQQVDSKALDELQLRLQARSIAIRVIEQTLEINTDGS